MNHVPSPHRKLCAGNKRLESFSALRQHARFLSPKDFQPSPQHNFLRRESAARVFSLLYQLSYSDLRRWQDSNLRPSTYEVTRAFTTPQNFLISAHTSSVHPPTADHSDKTQTARKIREELALTVIRESNPSLAALPLKQP